LLWALDRYRVKRTEYCEFWFRPRHRVLARSGSQANLLLSRGNSSERAIGVLRACVDLIAFGKSKPIWMMFDSPSGKRISSAPAAQPSPIA